VRVLAVFAVVLRAFVVVFFVRAGRRFFPVFAEAPRLEADFADPDREARPFFLRTISSRPSSSRTRTCTASSRAVESVRPT
jgi:hypothetical protein